jgi:hypothetical protein
MADIRTNYAAPQGKNALLPLKYAVNAGKNALLQAKDADVQRIQSELARCGDEAAVGGGVRPAPVLARVTAAAAPLATATAPASHPSLAPAPAAIAVDAAVATAVPLSPATLFPFSSDAEHKAPDVVPSPDRLTVTRKTNNEWAWVRSERGVGSGCGVLS